MTHHENLMRLTATTSKKVTDAYVLFQAGKISRTEATAVISSLISKANLQAAALADASLAATLTLKTGQAVPVTGVSIRSGGTTLARAVSKILTTPDKDADKLMRLQRIASTEPLGAAARASSKATKAQPLVEGWIRGLDPNPCQLCRWWSRDGQVWPKDHAMPHHKGCSCIQIPVTRERKKD